MSMRSRRRQKRRRRRWRTRSRWSCCAGWTTPRGSTNFLLCLPTIKHVLGLRWLQESQANNKFLSEESFALVDPEVETRFNFSFSRTLIRSSRDKLFSFSAIVKASGGRLEISQNIYLGFFFHQKFSGLNRDAGRQVIRQMKEFNSGGFVNQIVITCEKDIHLVSEV